MLFCREATAQVPDSLVVPVPVGAAVVLPLADTLFRVYGRVGSFGAKERAEAIERRLTALLKASSFAPDSCRWLIPSRIPKSSTVTSSY